MPENLSLGVSIQLIKGRVPKGADASNQQLLPYLTPEYLRGGSNIPELFPATDKTVQVEDGEIIILCDGSNAGEVFSAREGIVSSTMAVVKFDQRAIQRDFLFHYLKFYEPYLKAQTAGSGIPHLDKELLGLLPAIGQTEAAQIRIAAILTNLNQLITATEAQLAKQQRLRTGLLHDLLTRGLDQHSQLRSEETHEFKDSTLGRIPVDWEVKKLNQVCGVLNGFAFDSKLFTQEGGMPLIRIRDIEASTTTENYAGAYKPQYVVSKNDLLIGMDGEFNCRRWQGGPALLNQRVCKLVPIASKIDDSFLFNFIAGYLKKIEATTGATTVKHISSYQILDIEFACPDVTEQTKIGQMLNSQEQLSQQQTIRLAKLRRLKTGLMQDLLTGRVPVGDLDSLLPEA